LEDRFDFLFITEYMEGGGLLGKPWGQN